MCAQRDLHVLTHSLLPRHSAELVPQGWVAMAEASLVEQQIAVHKPGQLKAGDGTVDCEVLSLTRRGAQLRLLGPLGGPLGGQRDVFLSLHGFGQLSCSVLDVKRSEEHTSELQSLMRISYAV